MATVIVDTPFWKGCLCRKNAESAALSPAEWEVMKTLWDGGPLDARGVFAALPGGRKWAFQTVKTLLSRMVVKGAVAYDQVGNSYLYRAAVAREELTRHEVQSVLDRVVGAAVSPVLAHFIDEANLSDEEIQKLKRLLDEKRKKRSAPAKASGGNNHDEHRAICNAVVELGICGDLASRPAGLPDRSADIFAARCFGTAAVRVVAVGARQDFPADDALCVLGRRALGRDADCRSHKGNQRHRRPVSDESASRNKFKHLKNALRPCFPAVRQSFSLAAAMLAIWAAGCVALWLAVGWRYWRLTQTTNSMRQIDEGPVRIEIERLAEQFAIRTAPAVYATEQSISPMLIGVIAPKIVLPESFLNRLSCRRTADDSRPRARALAKARHVGWLAAGVRARRCFGFIRWCGSRTRGSGMSASVRAMKRCSAKRAAIATVTAKRLSECWPLPEAGAW